MERGSEHRYGLISQNNAVPTTYAYIYIYMKFFRPQWDFLIENNCSSFWISKQFPPGRSSQEFSALARLCVSAGSALCASQIDAKHHACRL